MKEKYYLFKFKDAFDDAYGGSHSFTNEIALSEKSFLFPTYDDNHISKIEITEKEYDEWNDNN